MGCAEESEVRRERSQSVGETRKENGRKKNIKEEVEIEEVRRDLGNRKNTDVS